jgi:hypothetical protein
MAQFGRPSADTYNADGYTDQGGGGSNIYTTIDEAVYSDADYIRSPLAPTSDVYVTKLSAVEDPVVHTGHTIRYRYAKDASGGATINLTVQLRQDYVDEGTPGTLIKEWQHSDISNTFTEGGGTLTEGEAGNITDYSNLYLRFLANQA